MCFIFLFIQCKFVPSQNTWLPSIIYNEWNISCPCNPGYEWESRLEMTYTHTIYIYYIFIN